MAAWGQRDGGAASGGDEEDAGGGWEIDVLRAVFLNFAAEIDG